jgi:disulfide bond formation protein DsbB
MMSPARGVPLLVLLASIAVVGAAQLFEHVGGLAPCELCLMERWPYYGAIAVSFLALAAPRRGLLIPALLALCGLLFLADVGLGGYHVAVEQHWVAGPAACTLPAQQPQTFDELKRQLLQQQPVRCDEVQWSFFGVSLAGLNAIAAGLLAVVSLAALPPLLRARPR